MALGLTLAMTAMAAGTGLQAYSRYKQGQLTQDLYNYNRSVTMEFSKQLRELRAFEEAQFLSETSKLPRKQITKTAAAGIEISGTPLKVMQETSQKLQEQAKIMETERAMEVSRARTQANIYGMRGSMASQAGRFGALNTLLTGGAQLGMMQYRYGG